MGDIGEIWGTLERTPSVHSKVCRSYSPYRLAYLWDGGGAGGERG